MSNPKQLAELTLNPNSKYDTVICQHCDTDLTGMAFCPECDAENDY